MSLSLLAVFAHPDDESFGPAGTLSKYARAGVRVSLVCATRGEAGKTGDPPVCRQEELGQVREQELRCAAEVLGIRDLIFLGYRDQQLDLSDREEATGKIVRAVRVLRPQVMITFGPDGISGHRDHVAIHHLATAAFRAAGDRGKYPEHLGEGLWPWTPQKLYYVAPSWRLMAALKREWPSGLEREITTVIEVGDFLDLKRRALECHRTQNVSVRKYMDLRRDDFRRWVSKEYFRLAESHVGRPEGVEDDLFRGLR